MNATPPVRLYLSLDEAAALNNALRREIEASERYRRDANMIGTGEYVRHLDGALRTLTSAYEAVVSKL